MTSIRSLSCVVLVVGILVSACSTNEQKKAGDGCRLESNASVCIDATTAGACRAFTWHVDACRGPAGCSAGVCDQSVALANDACAVDGSRACSSSGTQVLRCEHGTMVTETVCRGDRGCYHHAPNAPPACDVGVLQIGDACNRVGGQQCSADRKTMLQCSRDHHVILARHCLGARGCYTSTSDGDGHQFSGCDITVGDVGEPCEGYVGVGSGIGNGGDYCSSDGREVLTCKGGILAHGMKCACEVNWLPGFSGYNVGCADPVAAKSRLAPRH